VMIDSPHVGGRTGGVVAAPIFKRIAESTLRYMGIGPTINPAAPVLVERHEPANVRTSRAAVESPVVTFVSDGPAGTVPDLYGMSARDAVRKLANLGLAVQLTGDGVVATQDPPAGTAIDPGAVCRLVLNRYVKAREQVQP
jgi:cell division protein FtsI (penicillin-binding protein 3)